MKWKWTAITLIISLVLVIYGCSHTNKDSSWTIMLYMAGDNDLSSAALMDLSELEAAGSTGNVNVVVQLDTIDGPARRFIINHGRATLIEDIGEQNMADKQTLMEFIVWADKTYPAQHNALILWDHGDGFAKPLPRLKRILQDDTNGVTCCLSNTIVRQAIEESGVYFDLLGFDASQMGQVETAYEFRNGAGILVFSQETGQSNGWDYTAILTNLVQNPIMDGKRLSECIVKSYQEFYERFYEEENYPVDKRYHTISAINLSEINSLTQGINSLARSLRRNLMEEKVYSKQLSDTIKLVRGEVQELNIYTKPYTYIDLFDFMKILKGSLLPSSPPLTPLPDDVLQDVDNLLSMTNSVVLSEWHGPARPNATGLSIAFFKLPEGKQYNYNDYSNYLGDKKQIDFLSDTEWDEFLQKYYSVNAAS